MTKSDFLKKMRCDLSKLPEEEIEERISFYSEMIDDRIEEGLSEEEAVAAVGNTDEITNETKPTPKDEKRKLSAWEIVLLVLGSPIWFSLGIVLVSVVFSLYVVLWSLILSLWAVFVSLAVSAIALAAVGVVFAICNNSVIGCALIGAALVCAGVAIFMAMACAAATNGAVVATKAIFKIRRAK